MLKNFILFSGSLCFFLLLAEIGFRYNGKYYSYTERTNTNSYISPFNAQHETWYHVFPPRFVINRPEKEFTVSWTANNEGFNDHDFLVSKKGKRIIVLGDSFIEGIGATHDSTLTKQLYSLLHQLDTTVEVWNAGISGSDPFYEYRLFKDRLLKYQPDLAVVVMNCSDVHEVTVRGGFERFLPDSTVRYKPEPWFVPLYAHSILARRLVHDCFHYNASLSKSADAEKEAKLSNTKLFEVIDSFKTLCYEKHIQLLFVFHAFGGELVGNLPYEMLPVMDYCSTHKIPFVDTRQKFVAYGIDSSNWQAIQWPIDGHYNNQGYNYLAQSISSEVLEKIRQLMDSLAVKK